MNLKITTLQAELMSVGYSQVYTISPPDLEQLDDCSQCAKHLRLDLKITFKKVKVTFFRVVIAKSSYKRENENSKDCSVTRSVRPVK